MNNNQKYTYLEQSEKVFREGAKFVCTFKLFYGCYKIKMRLYRCLWIIFREITGPFVSSCQKLLQFLKIELLGLQRISPAVYSKWQGSRINPHKFDEFCLFWSIEFISKKQTAQFSPKNMWVYHYCPNALRKNLTKTNLIATTCSIHTTILTELISGNSKNSIGSRIFFRWRIQNPKNNLIFFR